MHIVNQLAVGFVDLSLVVICLAYLIIEAFIFTVASSRNSQSPFFVVCLVSTEYESLEDKSISILLSWHAVFTPGRRSINVSVGGQSVMNSHLLFFFFSLREPSHYLCSMLLLWKINSGKLRVEMGILPNLIFTGMPTDFHWLHSDFFEGFGIDECLLFWPTYIFLSCLPWKRPHLISGVQGNHSVL